MKYLFRNCSPCSKKCFHFHDLSASRYFHWRTEMTRFIHVFLYMKKNHQVKWSFTSKQLNDTIVFLVINYPVFSVVSLLLYHSIVAVKWPHDLIWLMHFGVYWKITRKNNQETSLCYHFQIYSFCLSLWEFPAHSSKSSFESIRYLNY